MIIIYFRAKIIMQLFLILLFTNPNLFICNSIHRNLNFSEIANITLHRNKNTISKNPIPQLLCDGNDLCKEYSPDVVQCFNLNIDGINKQWSCQANLSEKVIFENISLNCEKFNDFKSPYNLEDFCSLKYSLNYTNSDKFNEEDNYKWFFFGYFFLFTAITCCISFVKIFECNETNDLPTLSPSIRLVTRQNNVSVLQTNNNLPTEILSDNPPSYEECFNLNIKK